MTTAIPKMELLHEIAETYVLKGLGEKNFDIIPYDENVILRAPLCPGGSNTPLQGKENVKHQWWAPLPSLLGRVNLVDIFINDSNTAVVVEFYCDILNPLCTLHIIDRFRINENGKIIEQENFFDPRDVTNPGWNKSE